MQSLKKYLTAGVLFASIVLLTVACSSSSSDNADGSDDDMSIDAVKYTWADPPAKEGEGLELINEKLDIDYSIQFVPESDYNEKLTATMAGGDIPDMIATRSQGPTKLNFFKWAEQGAFLPLDDYIDDLEYKDNIPDHVWKSNTVDGQIYGIPTYYQQYTLTPIIRKDWLDNLGLDVPTTYEELKEVALAFTNEDPNDSGKDDTYGMVLGEGISPSYAFGPYWGSTWYHQDDEDNYMPGLISDGRKDVIEFLHELYEEGAVTQDFALLNHSDSEKEFYSGNGGIFYGSSYGMSDSNMESLVEIDPDAEVVALPPFEAPDGTKGYPYEIGYLGNVAISAENEGNTEKVEKMLEILDIGKTFVPWDERNPDNEFYDWLKGHDGEGYEMDDDGQAETLDDDKQPKKYLVDERSWAPTPEEAEEWKAYDTPQLIDLTKDISEMHNEADHYSDPTMGVISETEMSKGADLDRILEDAQTKMIGGEMPISDWDEMVDEYLEKGGQDVIDEFNEEMKKEDLEGEWE